MKKKKQVTLISSLAVIFLALVGISVLISFYNPDKNDSDKNGSEISNEKGCRTSEGYTWNETDGACVREDEKSSRYYINKDPEFCKRIQFLCVEDKIPFYNKNGCGCELKTTTQG